MHLRCPMDNRALHHKKKIIHKNFVEILNDVSQVIQKHTRLIAATLKKKKMKTNRPATVPAA